MGKVLTVAWREFVATVRTKAFIISTILMPALIVGAIYGGQFVEHAAKEQKLPTRKIAVVDRTGRVYPALAAQVVQYNRERPNQKFALEPVPPDAPEADPSALAARITGADLYAYIVVPDGVLSVDLAALTARLAPAAAAPPPGEAPQRPDGAPYAGTPDPELAESATQPAGPRVVLAREDNQLESGRRLERMINEAVYAVRMQEAGISPLEVAALRQPVEFELVNPSTGEQISDNMFARIMTPFAFMFLLFMGTFGIAQGLLTSLIEEKSSRVVEVLLSAVSPTQLMAGKILGMSLVGFVLLFVWGAAGWYGATTYNLADIVSRYRLVMALLYFLPGFLLFAGILAAIGSLCNELKEAQSMTTPITILTIVPIMFWFYLAEHPAAVWSVVLSYIPPIIPFVMILRICADPATPPWQIITTLAVLWASVLVAIWAAGKIFRVGVLMYGKPPSLRELVRWVRYS